MRRKQLLIFIFIFVIFLFGYGLWLYNRPIPQLHPQITLAQPPRSETIKLPWPVQGQAALGSVGFGLLDSNNASSPMPIASVAKVITALAILKERPLEAGQQGPLITITDADMQSYRDYLAKDGSVIPVNVGEQISEYQALQAMMLPSANNIADTAARWAFGSVENYVTYANRFVKSLGMNQAIVADASGFSSQTTSTAKDLVLLGEAALKNPALAQIVGQVEADFPNVGIIKNINWLLGTDGIIGIKTGNTDQAGGCFLFAAKRSVANRSVTMIGAILGDSTRDQAINDARTLLTVADKGFETTSIVSENQTVGVYRLPWGDSVDAVASGDLKVLNWKGKPEPISIKMEKAEIPSTKGLVVGSVKATDTSSKSVLLLLKEPVPSPPETWRLFR